MLEGDGLGLFLVDPMIVKAKVSPVGTATLPVVSAAMLDDVAARYNFTDDASRCFGGGRRRQWGGGGGRRQCNAQQMPAATGQPE